MATAIFYASSTGNTSFIAELIANDLKDIEMFDIAQTGIDKMKEFDNLIIGLSTWGEGELQDDFEESWEDFQALDLTDKKVALFGLGDQDGYPDNFVDAMGLVYASVVESGALVVGAFEIDDDFYFDESLAKRNDMFVGLAVDEDNQSELSKDRVEKWCETIRSEIL